MIKTIIFDLDGTLLDTLSDLNISVNAGLSHMNLPMRTLDETRTFVGNGIRNLVERSVPEGTAKEVTDKVFNIFKEHYKTQCKVNTRPYERIQEALSRLENDGYQMTIVSNKTDPAVQELLKEFFYPHIKTAYGERPGIKRKPDPEIVNIAIRETGSVKEECVYIGDSEVDFETAKRAGLKLIMVSWGFRDKKLLKSLGAELIADDVDEMISMIKEI